MEPSTPALTPIDAKQRIHDLLDAARLPQFCMAMYLSEIGVLQVRWAHGLSMDFDLSRDIEPFDDLDRRAILGLGLGERFPLPVEDLIDLAWSLDREQLREAFGRLRDEELLDPTAVHAERARVQGLLAVLDDVVEEFCGA